MKLGIIISLVIVLALAGLFVFLNSGGGDVLTKQTNERTLQQASLPTDLPPLLTPSRPDDDAGDLYLRALRLYSRNERKLERDTPDAQLAEEIVELIDQASAAGRVASGFLDRQIPMKTAPLPEFGGALEGIFNLLNTKAQKQFEANDQQGLLHTAQMTHLLGYRLFTHCSRLYNRRVGLDLMDSALTWMKPALQWLDDGASKHKAWVDAVRAVRDQWEPKIAIVHSVTPHIGDLLNIARNDQDLTFRVAGLLHLGIAKFNPGSVGHKKAIDAALEAASKDADPQIAAAAQAALAFTKEELRKVR